MLKKEEQIKYKKNNNIKNFNDNKIQKIKIKRNK